MSTPEQALAAIRERASLGRYAEGLALTDEALASRPHDLELFAVRGSILFEWGRFQEAHEDLAAAVAGGVRSTTLLIQLGWTSLRTGNAANAEQWMRHATASEGAGWQAFFGLGSTLRAQRRLDEAIAAYERALSLSPANATCMMELAECLVDARRLDDASELARRACAEHADDVAVSASRAALLMLQDRFDESNAIYDRIAASDAVRADPRLMPMDAGFARREGGRLDEALAFYARYLPSKPDTNAHMNYAFTLLKAGRLREGFEQYEYRWMIHPLITQRPCFATPSWRGQPLAGKTLLVIGEQGYGDTIQFARFLPAVRALGARLLLLMHKPIPEILDARLGIDQVVRVGEAIPAFDYYTHLMSLPHVLGTDLATIPQNVPYVFARDDRLAEWRRRIPTGRTLNVGLVWAGDPEGRRGRQKSLALTALAPLGDVAGVRFFSLQMGGADAGARQPPAGMTLTDLAPAIRDFADTAAICASMDLVISVCTSVAHLAGAMGRPTWTLLSDPADWRWLDAGDATPWYPTMRLFRQERPGDWAGVIERVRDALDAAAREQDDRSRAAALSHRSAASAPVPSHPSRVTPENLRIVRETRHGIFQVRPQGTLSERSLDYYGEDREAQVALLSLMIQRGATVLEAGSGVGAHAVAIARHVGDGGLVVVSEPRVELAQALRQNLDANALHRVAILGSNLLGGAPDGPTRTWNGDDDTAPIDRLGLRRLDWLKIGEDVDWARVLDGASATLWKCRPGVFAAAAGESDLERLGSRLRDFGYHCWRADAPRFRLDNFNRRDSDVFSGATAYAVLAIPEESTSVVAPSGLKAID